MLNRILLEPTFVFEGIFDYTGIGDSRPVWLQCGSRIATWPPAARDN